MTQGEYQEVMASNPSWFNGDHTADGGPNYGIDLNRPVEMVSWNDAVAYCAALTERERLAGRIAPNSVYRLPTEAEWEYACRAWTSTRFSYGDDPLYGALADYAWYRDNNGGITKPVGQKAANPWGLFDMHGNVQEWCQDWWGEYSVEIITDPQGPSSGIGRVTRGYLWDSGPWALRSAARGYELRDNSNNQLGFRIVLVPGQA